MVILGIDPGLRGALAWNLDGEVIRVEDMPVFQIMRGGKPRMEVDVLSLGSLIHDFVPDCVFMEQVNGMAGDGAAAAFQFGRAAGAAEAVAKLSGARFEFVTPPVWKKAMGLIGTAKDQSRAKATARWPKWAKEFGRAKDDGRAEAALLAEYGRKTLHEEGIFG